MASITQLQYILAVEKYRNFGIASKNCFVTQPTLSMQIQKLEEEIEIIIFDRIQKPIVPTYQGKIFLEQARRVVNEHEKLISLSKSKSNGLVGTFRLGIIPTVSSSLIPLFLKGLSESLPMLNLIIEEINTETIIDQLKRDNLDGAILATPLHQSGLKESPLYYEPFLLYLPLNHPLTKKEFIKNSDIDGSEMWMLKDGNCFKTQVAEFCSLKSDQTPIIRNVAFASGNLETLRNVIRLNLGYTMIPQLMTKFMTAMEIQKHVRPFRSPEPTREISFVYRRDFLHLEKIEALKTLVKNSVPKDLLKRNLSQTILEFC